MYQKLLKLSKNPLVRRLVIWLGPLILGWVMKKIDQPPQKSKATKQSTRKK